MGGLDTLTGRMHPDMLIVKQISVGMLGFQLLFLIPIRAFPLFRLIEEAAERHLSEGCIRELLQGRTLKTSTFGLLGLFAWALPPSLPLAAGLIASRSILFLPTTI